MICILSNKNANCYPTKKKSSSSAHTYLYLWNCINSQKKKCQLLLLLYKCSCRWKFCLKTIFWWLFSVSTPTDFVIKVRFHYYFLYLSLICPFIFFSSSAQKKRHFNLHKWCILLVYLNNWKINYFSKINLCLFEC